MLLNVFGSVARLKHSQFARTALFPFMNLQYRRRDYKYSASRDSRAMRSFDNCHAGQRCFIIGNGPSLTPDQLEMVSGEITFASNRIYLMFDNTTWRPTYYLAVDREFIAQESQQILSSISGVKFLNLTPFSQALSGRDGVVLINKRPKYFSVHKYTTDNICFSERPYEYLAEGYTVTYTALQLALYMGFTEIYLLGMDHTYNVFVDSRGIVRTRRDVNNHCYDDPKGAVINPQYVEGTEFAYRIARIVAERRNAHIFNATPGGGLELFDRIMLDNIEGLVH